MCTRATESERERERERARERERQTEIDRERTEGCMAKQTENSLVASSVSHGASWHCRRLGQSNSTVSVGERAPKQVRPQRRTNAQLLKCMELPHTLSALIGSSTGRGGTPSTDAVSLVTGKP